MIKLAVLFQEEETRGVDLSHPEKGNPGVGGTAFCFILFLKYMQKYSDIDIRVYKFQDNILPTNNEIVVDGMREALDAAKSDGAEIILIRNHQTDEAYEILQQYEFKYIFWMHNKLTYKEIRLFSKWKNVKRVVAVGHEMYDYYVDDIVCEKLTYILNPFVPPSTDFIRPDSYSPSVVYVGSLTYDKNFHLLTSVWREILDAVPDATLHVIGSGRLYDKNSKLGKFGHAEESYEDLFMPPILDEAGNPLKSVIFHGIMGDDKYEVFKDGAVGVINPMATETFGLAAVEMEACGMPIVCRKKNGLLDAVKDGETGTLYKDISGLAPAIIKLLSNKELNKEYHDNAIKFARDVFLPENIMPKWAELIRDVSADVKAKYIKPKENLDNNGKRIRCILHGIHSIPFLRFVPSVHDLQKK